MRLEGDSPAEVRRKVNALLREARREGLYEDRKSQIEKDPSTGKHYQVLRVHT